MPTIAVATFRHDLRNPINQVIGYGEMLLETIEELDPDNNSAATLALAATSVTKRARQLLKIINTGLTEPIQTVALQDWLHQMLPLGGELLKSTETLKSSSAPQPEIAGDCQRMYQAAQNLHTLLSSAKISPDADNNSVLISI